MTEDTRPLFDDLQQFIDAIRDGAVTHADIDAAQNTLDELQTWCDAEALASLTNFQCWQKAEQKIDELRAEVAHLELTLNAQSHLIAKL